MSNIDCEQAMANLYDYLKQELTPDLVLEVRQHLDQCRDCFSSARFEENFLLMLETQASRETCPGKLRARILAALRAEAQDS
jgi:mycothiol system anti-sigma-R factor